MKHNQSLRTGERHLRRFSKTAKIAARYTDIVLEDYEILTQYYLEHEDLARIRSHSAGLLHKLKLDKYKSERELEKELGGNDEDMVHLIIALKYLADPGLSQTKTRQYYKEVRNHLKGIREELASIYAPENRE